MRDFTPSTYSRLIAALQEAGYRFVTMQEIFELQSTEKTSAEWRTSPNVQKTSAEWRTSPNVQKKTEGAGKVCCMRHDVDLKADHSLAIARIEHEMGVRAVYYFRVIPESNKPDIIKQIAALGHEIGYHYEDMSIFDGDIDKAYEHFCRQLDYFRTFYPVKTICMHGAPTSRYDGRDLWKKYDYHSLDIVCEPYLDLDYSRLLYLTDTGRRWDGYKVSLRDKIPVLQDKWTNQGLTFHSTFDIINALQQGRLTTPVLFTTHPQRWTDKKGEWWKELIIQNLKNIIKRCLNVI